MSEADKLKLTRLIEDLTVSNIDSAEDRIATLTEAVIFVLEMLRRVQWPGIVE